MAKRMWITTAKSISRKVLPAGVRSALKSGVGMVDYRFKRHRESPTDYVARFDHKDVGRARRSILWHDDWDGATEATISILRELDVVRDGCTVIDYGCGIGRMSKALVESFDLDKVYSVDRSEEMREHALDYLPAESLKQGKIELISDVDIVERAESLSGKVDALLFIEVMQHIPEPILDELLPKLLSTLKPGGKLFVIGNQLLDVDNGGVTGKDAKSIGDFLPKHAVVEQHDVRSHVELSSGKFNFYSPRYVFACTPKEVTANV